jgi:hypothetical protein
LLPFGRPVVAGPAVSVRKPYDTERRQDSTIRGEPGRSPDLRPGAVAAHRVAPKSRGLHSTYVSA